MTLFGTDIRVHHRIFSLYYDPIKWVLHKSPLKFQRQTNVAIDFTPDHSVCSSLCSTPKGHTHAQAACPVCMNSPSLCRYTETSTRTGQKYDFLSLDLAAVQIVFGKFNSYELLLNAVAVVACANVMEENNSLKPN